MAKHQLRFHVSLLFLVLLVTSTLAARKAIKSSSQARRRPTTSASYQYVQQYNTRPSSGPYRSSNVGSRTVAAAPSSKPNTRQIQQWQIAVNIPPGAVQQSSNSPSPPGPALPGHIWIQVPVSGANYPQAPPEAAIQPVPAPVSSPPQPPPQQQHEHEHEHEPSAPEEESQQSETSGENDLGPAPIDSDPEKLKHCKEPRGQFASPDDCTKFYNCWDGFVAEQSCPNGLAFSNEGPFCDYVENVDCSDRGGSPPSAPADTPQQQGEQGEGGSSEVTGAFHEEGQEGEYNEQGDEEEEGEQVSEQELAEDVGEGCQEQYSRYRSPKHCDVFIVCDNSVPHRFKCPATLHYNEELGICDYPYRVDCGASSPSESSVLAPSPPPGNDLEEEQQEQVPEDVLRYYGGFAKRPPVPVGYFRQG